uniref:Uncharacterized protein n=1 Tax=Rhizophagus irregularis (strain DAOM 181602 / DAOM 197198 / MUCL 43194) TaxID=747089 RepID=U9TBV0_RHIID
MTKFSNNFSYLLEKPCYISDVTIEVMGENDRDRSKAEEEESDGEGRTVSVNKKSGGKPSSHSKGRGGRRRHVNK